MTDVRETILARLYEVAKTVSSSAKRMDFDVVMDDAPCIVLVDGEESQQSSDPFAHSVQVAQQVQMDPHFALLIQTSERAGPALSAMRAKLIKAIVNDDVLPELTGYQSGARKIGARYMGCDTGVQMGEGLIAFMTLRFSLIYQLKPTDL